MLYYSIKELGNTIPRISRVGNIAAVRTSVGGAMGVVSASGRAIASSGVGAVSAVSRRAKSTGSSGFAVGAVGATVVQVTVDARINLVGNVAVVGASVGRSMSASGGRTIAASGVGTVSAGDTTVSATVV